MTNKLPVGLLQEQLRAARAHTKSELALRSRGSTVHVPGIGRSLSSAYEQLRNAAEYTEDHLVLQHAIRRFCGRNLPVATKREVPDNFGEELIIELTQAGYFANDVYSSTVAGRITASAKSYTTAYWQMRDAGATREVVGEWLLDTVAVYAEETLNPHSQLTALAYFEYSHYASLLPKQKFLDAKGAGDDEADYEICLYIAVHYALLKSDRALVRADLLRLYRQGPEDLSAYVAFNTRIDRLLRSELTRNLERAVSRYGAPMRVLNSMAAERDDMPELLKDRKLFMDEYMLHLAKVYADLGKRLDAGLLKSIIFIFVTKMLIGLVVEIPYDLLVYGSVALVPLLVNLLVPPLYMASLKLSLNHPTLANAEAVRAYMERALFTSEPAVAGTIRAMPKRMGPAARIGYTLVFLVPLAIVATALYLLDFSFVQAVIFMMFLSTASFLGFRLSRMVRDLELVSHDTSLLTAASDFFYLPFIMIGRWVSSKYAQVNVVAHLLDMGIELPLKSSLKLARQWIKFIRDRQEEMY